MTATQTVMEAVRDVAYGPARTIRNLTLVPLLTGLECEADYLVLDEAQARGWIEITETTDAGRVPELQVINRGDAAVLLLDGEELLGAKQNRVLNLTILVPPHQTRTIPVSCVEAGRWRWMSESFASAPRAQFAEGRAAKMRQVSASLSASRQRASDQGAIWSLIEDKASRLGVASDTSAMAAMYERAAVSLEEFVTACAPVERQVGAVFILNGRVAGLELFDAAST